MIDGISVHCYPCFFVPRTTCFSSLHLFHYIDENMRIPHIYVQLNSRKKKTQLGGETSPNLVLKKFCASLQTRTYYGGFIDPRTLKVYINSVTQEKLVSDRVPGRTR